MDVCNKRIPDAFIFHTRKLGGLLTNRKLLCRNFDHTHWIMWISTQIFHQPKRMKINKPVGSFSPVNLLSAWIAAFFIRIKFLYPMGKKIENHMFHVAQIDENHLQIKCPYSHLCIQQQKMTPNRKR